MHSLLEDHPLLQVWSSKLRKYEKIWQKSFKSFEKVEKKEIFINVRGKTHSLQEDHLSVQVCSLKFAANEGNWGFVLFYLYFQFL